MQKIHRMSSRFKQRIESFLSDKCDAKMNEQMKKYEKLKTIMKKKIFIEWKLDKVMEKCKKLDKEFQIIKTTLKHKLDSSPYQNECLNDIARGIVEGKLLDKEIKKRAMNEFNIDKELNRLRILKNSLIEEIWLMEESGNVKQILDRMK